jgi:hypothetical protein
MVSFETLYNQFLSSVSSYTLAQLSDDEVRSELFNLTERSIATFKFPKMPLTYTPVEDETTGEIIHHFDNDVTQRELNVLLAYMKVAWIDFQISKEEKFRNQYYDDQVRTFSAANMIAQLNRMYENFLARAKEEEYNYGRVNPLGRPSLGDING